MMFIDMLQDAQSLNSKVTEKSPECLQISLRKYIMNLQVRKIFQSIQKSASMEHLRKQILE